MTDYTHVAMIGIGVAAVAAGAYLAQMNAPIGAILVTIGLGILGYKSLIKDSASQTPNTPSTSTA